MSFAIPYLFRSSAKKKRDHNATTHQSLPSTTPVTTGILPTTTVDSSSSGISSDSDSRDQPYPTLVAMTQSRGTPCSRNPSPTSSTTSRSRPTSLGTHPTMSLEPEELDENRFYRYIRSHFNLVFSRSTVVCIPHSRAVEGMILTKDFIETHSYNPSPYYQGQYQAANGKVIAIELPIISTVSGFKDPRAVYVMSEEWVYIGRKKIRVLVIDRALEGDPLPPQPRSPNTLSIPTVRNSKTDLDFLNMLPENAEAMYELQMGVQKFVNTYVYIRGFNQYTVDKIQHMYGKAYRTILQKNSRLREACRIQAEHDHFLELVENVVMGFLYEKIWVQSLRAILQSQDNYLDSICRAYARETITLDRYAVSHPMADMPLECFEAAIACLRRVDTETEGPISVDDDRLAAPVLQNTSGDQLAFTPLEKLACVRMTLDLITAAVSDYIQSTSVTMIKDAKEDDSPVTADEMIPLFAYILVHSRIPRIASLAFYMEHFRLSLIERSEHSFVLVTLKAASDFLKADPLSLHDANSSVSTLSTSSTPTALSPKLQQNIRTRSTSFGSSPVTTPQANVSGPQNSLHYRSVSMSSAAGTPSLRHRKSQSADLHNMAVADAAAAVDEYDRTNTNRRNSLTPSVIIRPIVAQQQSTNNNRRSLDISNDWMVGKHYQHHHQAPKIPTISHSRPIISTTFPTISNSTPLPGLNQKTTPPSSASSSCHGVPSSPTTITSENRKLARSLSSTSSLYCGQKIHHPPEIINLRSKGRPASICIDPRSMHQDKEEDEEDDLGDFLRGLQSVNADIVGERSGAYRAVRRL